jgi:salicylate biosynthesis isochorismate synthase/menaquinone-specific isochorismate synthase
LAPGTASASSPFALGDEQRAELAGRARAAVASARRAGAPTLLTLTLALEEPVDPAAVAFASRRAGEPLFAFEQPDRSGAALAALGEVARLQARGQGRFRELAERWRGLCQSGPGAEEGGDAGPVAVGGFAFAPDGGQAPHWEGFAPGMLTVPEVALVRRAAEPAAPVRMTLAALTGPDDVPEQLVDRLQARVSELRQESLPLLDPAPTGRFRVVSAMPPEHYEQAVAAATRAIAEGRLEKVVLAREVQVHAPAPHDPAAVFGVLREQFPSCFTFCTARGEAALIGASPELLIRREGQRVGTLALAGSTRRSADPAVDDHLGEQLLRDHSYREEHDIVARRIQRTLRPHSVWVTAAPEPGLVQIANIQHLATPIRAQLAAPIDALELAGLMHPTPAVGGEPVAAALPLIPALEGLDRGWYAGPLGYTDGGGDGEFCVALRCALLTGTVARCYAGNGIVRGSEPERELAETEIKLQALLPLLSG